MEMKVWMIIIYSLVALCHCAPAQDDNAERHKRGCSSPKAKPGAVYYEGCTKFECKKKRRTFVWEETLDSGVCCIVENKGFPVGSVIFTNSSADNCTISTLTCRNIGQLPSLFYQDQDNQCSNEEVLEALEMIKKEMEMNSNHTEELLVEHAKHTEELLVEHAKHTEELLEGNANHTEELLEEHDNHTAELLEGNANHTEELLVEHAKHTEELLEENASLTEDEMETIKTMLDTLLIMHKGCDQGDVTVVSGNQYTGYPVEKLLTHDKAEKHEIGKTNYWVSPDGVPGTFILNLGCKMRFSAVQLVNSRSGGYRSTRQFRLFTSLTESGPWTLVLETELEDGRQQMEPLPLQVIALDRLDRHATAQFVKFQMITWYGHSGGLMFFDIQRN